ncbi:hypothetical protein DL768_000458 [Monosporascus sp. mg162]|nr:hypothetical protein DL768_000458 [Monosporascus sp. mg162]
MQPSRSLRLLTAARVRREALAVAKRFSGRWHFMEGATGRREPAAAEPGGPVDAVRREAGHPLHPPACPAHDEHPALRRRGLPRGGQDRLPRQRIGVSFLYRARDPTIYENPLLDTVQFHPSPPLGAERPGQDAGVRAGLRLLALPEGVHYYGMLNGVLDYNRD